MKNAPINSTCSASRPPNSHFDNVVLTALKHGSLLKTCGIYLSFSCRYLAGPGRLAFYFPFSRDTLRVQVEHVQTGTTAPSSIPAIPES